MITKIATLDEAPEFNEREKPKSWLPYKDIKSNAWYATYVNKAYPLWLLKWFTDSHPNKKELKAFTPISRQQLNWLITQAGGEIPSTTSSTQKEIEVLWLLLPAKQKISLVRNDTVSREEAADIIVEAFPDVFENYTYLVGNNGVYLGKILDTIKTKPTTEQHSYLVKKIDDLKKADADYYGDVYHIDVEVIAKFLEEVIK